MFGGGDELGEVQRIQQRAAQLTAMAREMLEASEERMKNADNSGILNQLNNAGADL